MLERGAMLLDAWTRAMTMTTTATTTTTRMATRTRRMVTARDAGRVWGGARGVRERGARAREVMRGAATRAEAKAMDGGEDEWTYLQRLKITNFALVSEQTVEFERGLNVITGKSGSGKSVLLDAIAQICGSPAREESIRANADLSLIHISEPTRPY